MADLAGLGLDVYLTVTVGIIVGMAIALIVTAILYAASGGYPRM